MTCRPTFFIDTSEYDTLVDEVISAHHSVAGLGGLEGFSLDSDKSMLVGYLASDLASGYGKRPDIRRIRGLRIGRIDLLTLTETQIHDYLRQRDAEFQKAINEDWHKVRKFLYSVYDIRDLMRRPILLDMIVRTVLLGHFDVNDFGQRIGAADIYEAYITALFLRERDDRETRRSISVEARQWLLELVALTIFKSGHMDTTFEEIAAGIATRVAEMSEVHAELSDKSVDHITGDIILTGLLSIDIGGKLRFAHKSFMEYLVARRVKNKMSTNTHDELMEEFLPSDIIYFMGSLMINNTKLFDAVARALRSTDVMNTNIAKNLARALCCSGAKHEDFSLNSIEVTQISARKVHWAATELKDVLMDVNGIEEQKYENCILENVTFKGTTGMVLVSGGGIYRVTSMALI